jgi:hypothetical protein
LSASSDAASAALACDANGRQATASKVRTDFCNIYAPINAAAPQRHFVCGAEHLQGRAYLTR